MAAAHQVQLDRFTPYGTTRCQPRAAECHNGIWSHFHSTFAAGPVDGLIGQADLVLCHRSCTVGAAKPATDESSIMIII